MYPYPPDPYGDEDHEIKVFDSGRGRFKDVPLVEFSPEGPTVRRGTLPDCVFRVRLHEAGSAIDALPGEVFGVLTNALADLVLAEEGVDFGYDVRFGREIVIDFTVPETACPADLHTALDDILANVIGAQAELVRTLSAGWRVFHVQSGVDTRISCYDPTYPAGVQGQTTGGGG